MTPDEIVRAFISAIEAKDIPAAAAMVAPDISYENMPMQPVVGRDAMVAVLDGFLARADEVEWIIHEQWTDGRTVINERNDRFRIGDGWLELPIAGIFKIDENDQITLWRDYFDLSSYMNQMKELTADD